MFGPTTLESIHGTAICYMVINEVVNNSAESLYPKVYLCAHLTFEEKSYNTHSMQETMVIRDTSIRSDSLIKRKYQVDYTKMNK